MSSEQPYQKKLIEVALPLDAINAESAREKSIRHGHPSTLHLWWARRPLAACRAVLFAQLVDDPSAHPERFPTEEEQDAERQRLFRIIEDLVKWENSTNEEVLERARAEIRTSCDGNPPPILDPFAGGGSIPLEAQRLGLEAHASDLNPVAVLINKALIEIPLRWQNRPPVHSDASNRAIWTGAEGLAEDIRCYSAWMRDEAKRRIGHLFPDALLPSGGKATVIAWIWARTASCPNPACGAEMPLMRSFWLSKRPSDQAHLVPVIDGRSVSFEVSTATPSGPVGGTMTKTGAQCLVCGESVRFDFLRAEGSAGRMSERLIAAAVRGTGREFVIPDASHVAAASGVDPSIVGAAPRAEIPSRALGFRVGAYGVDTFDELLTNRQLAIFTTLVELIDEVREQVKQVAAGDDGYTYARDLGTYLALATTKAIRYSCKLATWRSDESKLSHGFGSQTVPMVWDFAEANPFSGEGGDLSGSFSGAADVLEKHRGTGRGQAEQADARVAPMENSPVIATDPPYYDNVGYAALSDLFYSWLRLALASDYPELFSTVLTPKDPELISEPGRHESQAGADDYYEQGFVDVFTEMIKHASTEAPISVFYAFKQNEKIRTTEDLLGSTGWSTMLEGLMTAGWAVTATWPLVTEGKTRRRGQGSNALATSILLACRPRPTSAAVADRRTLMRSLLEELPAPVRSLQKAHIAPVDLRQAAIGPGMAIFSRFDRVIEPDGSRMRVQTALGLINQVLSQVLDEQEESFDAQTRWAIQWFTQFFEDEGPYGLAEQLAVSMAIAVSAMVDSGMLASGGGKARLLARSELPDDWDPLADTDKTIWEATHHLVKRLETGGEASAGRLLRRLGGIGEDAQLLAYRLYTVCEKSRPALAGPYNALVASWPEIQRHAREATESVTVHEQQTLDQA